MDATSVRSQEGPMSEQLMPLKPGGIKSQLTLHHKSIAVVSWGPNRLDIFALGTDNSMFQKTWNGEWLPSPKGWQPIGGTFASPPAVVSWGPNRLDIFALGTDNSMFLKTWNKEWLPSPKGWQPIGGTFASPPAVVSWGPGRIDIFALGTDNSMFLKTWNGKWPPSLAWQPLGGTFDPA